MIKKFVTRALMIAGLTLAGYSASSAQQVYSAQVRCIPTGGENRQPVVASALLADAQGGFGKAAAGLSLSTSQRTQVADLAREASSIQAERDRLWSEYKSITTAPGYNDQIAQSQAAPRMFRILALNKQLSAIASSQEVKMATILNAQQRTAVAQMVTAARAQQ